MRGGLVDYRLNEPRPPGRRISWNPRTENVRRVQIVGGSDVPLALVFAGVLTAVRNCCPTRNLFVAPRRMGRKAQYRWNSKGFEGCREGLNGCWTATGLS